MPTNSDNLVEIESTYIAEGNTIVRKWRVVGEPDWHFQVTAHKQVPFVFKDYMSKEEFKDKYGEFYE